MPDVFQVLRAHDEVKQLLEELEAGPGRAGGATPAQLEARGQLATRLIIESSKHEAAEEQYVWSAVRDRVPGGDQLADHAIGQEDEAKQVLAQLDKPGPDDAMFDELIASLIPAARDHIGFEQDQVWPRLRQALSAQEAQDLGKKLQSAKESAPARPHPHTPASPGVLKGAGPAVAAADRLRDIATGRGNDRHGSPAASTRPAAAAGTRNAPSDGTAARSAGELVQELSEQLSRLVRDELKLAGMEMTRKASRAARGIGMLSGSGIIALFGVGCLLLAAIAGLAIVLPAWAAALVAGAALLAAAGAGAIAAKRQLAAAVPPVPEKTVESVKTDVEIIKERAHR